MSTKNKTKETNTGQSTSATEATNQHGKDRYVIPQKNNKWGMKMDGEDGAFQYNSKKEAVAKATEEAKKAHSSVNIQKENGQVEKRTSYGK